MGKKRLAISDLHLSEKGTDQFMWDIFPQVEKVIDENEIDGIDILGDLCHEKDGHSSWLINKIVKGLRSWFNKTPGNNILLHGNHDSISHTTPYFQFMEEFDNVYYINMPWEFEDEGAKYLRLYLPHTENPVEDWKDIDFKDKIVYAHIAVNECVSETGFQMKNPLSADVFNDAAACLAGDIHQSQIIGKLEYIGSPYATRFGNNEFIGRAIILDTETLKREPVYFDFPRRLTFEVETLDDYQALKKKYDLNKDQVKIKLTLTPETAHQKRQLEADLKAAVLADGSTWGGCQISHSEELTPERVKRSNRVAQTKDKSFEDYCAENQITGAMKQMGLDLIEKAKKL